MMRLQAIPEEPLSIVEASIDDLRKALASGRTTSVELVARYLHRIAQYDRRGLLLNAIPVLNTQVFEDAAKSDLRRAAGLPLGRLEGIPCTIKDSYKIKGMTVASGSPAFRDLIANEDAFTVGKLREAGAIFIGRTNMPPMAAGGMQRGLYGRAESPYNSEYLTGAFASGSSNGSATATAASFGAFGMCEETVSSGRSPASNNALVAYTPSRGIISTRGNWPLFPSCDTVVPHTRTVTDMFDLLDVIIQQDDIIEGDFWREQQNVPLPDVHEIRPSTYHELADTESLQGMHIGVPRMYIGGEDPEGEEVTTRQSVINLWNSARSHLESLGAIVTEVDFPVVTNYEKVDWTQGSALRNKIDITQLMAYAWDDFLIGNKDPSCPSLSSVDNAMIFPVPPGIPDKYNPADPLGRLLDVVGMMKDRIPTHELPGMEKALPALEDTRETDFEDWLDENDLDFVVWPANGDVGRADADINEESSIHAWKNGVKYSNGNYAICHLGIPTVSVPMGIMSDTKMPVNLTFASKAYDDSNLFRYAYAYESLSKNRITPPLTPQLETDLIAPTIAAKWTDVPIQPILTVDFFKSGDSVVLSGTITFSDGSGLQSLAVYIDGVPTENVVEKDGEWKANAKVVSVWKGRPEEEGTPATRMTMVVVLAKGNNGGATGKLLFV